MSVAVRKLFESIGALVLGRSARLLAVIAVSGLLLAGLVYLWRNHRDAALGGLEYQLTTDRIETTEQPLWINADVKGEVFRDAGWDEHRLSLLDPELTIKIAQAFATHSWIARVTRVSKHHPARVVVQLEYRRPVAMVEVNLNGQSGLLPVDMESVLLPPDDFSSKQAGQFPRISVEDSIPAGPVGTPWGDPRVLGAAKIATVLGDAWHAVGLYRITAVHTNQPRMRAVEPTFELQTRGGSRIVWGHAPGQERSGEATATIKAERLAAFVAQQGPLDTDAGPMHIDLRDARSLSAGPRTARLKARVVQ